MSQEGGGRQKSETPEKTDSLSKTVSEKTRKNGVGREDMGGEMGLGGGIENSIGRNKKATLSGRVCLKRKSGRGGYHKYKKKRQKGGSRRKEVTHPGKRTSRFTKGGSKLGRKNVSRQGNKAGVPMEGKVTNAVVCGCSKGNTLTVRTFFESS